jgi:hypothetical protein
VIGGVPRAASYVSATVHELGDVREACAMTGPRGLHGTVNGRTAFSSRTSALRHTTRAKKVWLAASAAQRRTSAMLCST